jgi:hypothetical protein
LRSKTKKIAAMFIMDAPSEFLDVTKLTHKVDRNSINYAV